MYSATSSERSGPLQLTFDVNPPAKRTRKASSSHPRPGASPRTSSLASTQSASETKPSNRSYSTPFFHADGSSIANDRFALKFLFGDRSYLIQGAYRIHEGKSRFDGEEYTTVESVRIDRIYAYKNGVYVFIPVTKAERERFESAVFEVLVNPRYNESFSGSNPHKNPLLSLIFQAFLYDVEALLFWKVFSYLCLQNCEIAPVVQWIEQGTPKA